MSTSAAIWTGILSSAIASIIFAISALVWKELIYPKLKAMRYGGIQINGSWHCNPDHLVQEIYLTLEQSADQLSGSASFVSEDRSNNDHEAFRTFKITGFIKDGIILLNSISDKNNRIGIQAFVLKLSGDGRQLDGIFSYYSLRGPLKDQISQCRVRFFHETCGQSQEHLDELVELIKPKP